MSADAAADADADAAERRLNHSIPRTYFVRGIQSDRDRFPRPFSRQPMICLVVLSRGQSWLQIVDVGTRLYNVHK